jgi:uncharacterized OB-fold protein
MLEPQPIGIPAPVPSAVSAPYWEAAHRGLLLYQRCDACGTIAVYPTRLCGECLGRSLSWVPSGGLGSLYSWTVVWRPQRPSFQVPYAPAIVELDEGYRMVSSIVGCEPEDLRDGMRLAVEFHPASETVSLPYFRPAG